MNNVPELLDELYEKAKKNTGLKERLLQTENSNDSYADFCRIAREEGIALYPMELLDAGEQSYGDMKRSTNGGGENSPLIEGEDDFYALFLAMLRTAI